MKVKRILSFIGITSIVMISGVVTLILFPQSLFSNSFEYKNFEVYSNYDVNQEAFKPSIEAANAIIMTSELFDANYQYDIFLAHNTVYNQIDDLIFGSWSIARAVDNNVIIKNPINEVEGIVNNGQNEFDLIYVLAHEMIHCLQENKYGKSKFNPMNHPPIWKLEGYPEYIARNKTLKSENYHLKKGIEEFLKRTSNGNENLQIIQISENESTPYMYYKGRLMIEYLMDIKKMNYDEILRDTSREEVVYLEMMDWYEGK